MKLIIAEKPNVAKQLKDALEPQAKWQVIKKTTKFAVGYYEGTKYIYASAQGHLFTLQEPGEINPQYTKWDAKDIPMVFPDNMPLKASKTAEPAYFKMLQTLICRKDIDEIIVATDPDREGQNIYEKIKRMIPHFPSVLETRIWIKEWTPQGLRDAMDTRKPNSEYEGLKIAAECREQADAIIGWNDTRIAQLWYGTYGNMISLGRVQTPTTGFTVQRELEIQNFKPEDYAILALELSSDTLSLEKNITALFKYTGKDKLTKQQADDIYKVVSSQKTYKVTTDDKKSSIGCLPLYNTVEIQKEMNKLYGFNASKTSEILEELYRKGLTTYPRTDMKKISASSAKIAINAIKELNRNKVGTVYTQEVEDRHYTIAKSVISSESLPHEAITPSYGSISSATIAALNTEERKVYDSIIMRFTQAFFPNCETVTTTATTSIMVNAEDVVFQAKGVAVIEPGWTQVCDIDKSQFLPAYTSGNFYDLVNIKKENKKTQPPARYTEASLLDAMEMAGRFLDDAQQISILKNCKGIGTGATRDEILKNIKNRNYITLSKKTIYPTEKAMSLFAVLPQSPLTSPAMTAQMEMYLDEVEQGMMSKEEFLEKVNKQVEDFVNAVKATPKKVISTNTTAEANKNKDSQTLGACPICGNPVLENSKAYYCVNWKNGCKFAIWKTFMEKNITPAMVKQLVQKKQTSLVKGLRSKFGKVYDRRLMLDDTFQIAMAPEKKTSVAICPKCGNSILENEKSYYCESYKTGCKLTIWKNALSKMGKETISKKEAKQLFAGKTITVDLVSKSGKPYKGKATYNVATNRIEVSW